MKSTLRPFCTCGWKSRVVQGKEGVYILCPMCNRRTKEYATVEQARKIWVKYRGRR